MHRDEAIYARSDARGPVEGITIEDRYARHIHRLLWEALLPEHEYPIETRTEGEWLLAQLAARLEASS